MSLQVSYSLFPGLTDLTCAPETLAIDGSDSGDSYPRVQPRHLVNIPLCLLQEFPCAPVQRPWAWCFWSCYRGKQRKCITWTDSSQQPVVCSQTYSEQTLFGRTQFLYGFGILTHWAQPNATKDILHQQLHDLLRQASRADVVILSGDMDARIGCPRTK